ncbi:MULTISPECIES: sugar phosphate isomerase/epimerase family protein [Gordonia]|jgi:inosose dehydratase|uniref:Sugar phosphate isomerase/epimerase n=2 Tax=Gordonia TaxID=2053 RepID=A0A9X3I658_9ACTN|nr:MULTISPECIES: sugar phosphate isomerase/epimerase [Gordonia]MAU82745.1 inosose dehydratase [Gordonia sp. (in: high G+C Gram-positive bacteria)]MCF3940363.1 sugar phosphate isomerase/epimerase [Gordonia tangerina]MCX2965189.1 sugar phosphate isomerase/epimerase [Gordonia aquimaris]
MTTTDLRIAAAPISWGVCEVPGWGYQLSPERVLGEMRELGVTAAETGPEGFLPSAPAQLRDTLAAYDLRCVGSFVPVVLHQADHDPAPAVNEVLDRLETSGGDVLVLAAATGVDGYDDRPDLTEVQWNTLLANLDRLGALAASRGVTAALHPHVGTMVEQRDEVYRVLENTTIGLCLDTGHLLIGGTDPLEMTQAYTDRITHAHLKDVRIELAEKVQRGEMTYTDAVAQGMYVPLGAGEAKIAKVVATLVDAGFDGWYVLEQDTILTDETDGDAAAGNVAVSMSFLRKAAARPVRV